MSETKLVREIQGELSKGDVRLFRNNTGRMQSEDGRWVQFGLCPGSSDLIGWRSVVVTTEMVGKKIAVFTALEVKSSTGSLTREQFFFLSTVKNMGGYADMVRSLSSARQVLNLPDNKATLP